MKSNPYTVVYEPQIEHALNEIAFYYAQQGEMALAEKMLDNIIVQIDKLHTLPFHYPAAHFSNEIRKMVIQTPPYLVYYTIVDTEVRYSN